MRLALALCLLILVACGGDSTGPGTTTGDYALTLLGGAPLPVLVLDSFDPTTGNTLTFTVTGGQLRLSGGGTFTLSVTQRVVSVEAGVTTTRDDVLADAGTWTAAGASAIDFVGSCEPFRARATDGRARLFFSHFCALSTDDESVWDRR